MDTSPRSATPPAALAPAPAAAQAPTPIDAARPDVGPAHPGDNRQPVTLMVNGRTARLQVDPAMPLVFALRDHLGLTGTKYSCLEGACGTCTVHLDGQAVRACLLPVAAAAGHAVTTIEGLDGADGQALRAAWTRHAVPQCGYCQSGQLMHAAAQLAAWRGRAAPGESAALAEEVRDVMGQVLCRCGTYQRIQDAVMAVVLSPGNAAAVAGTRRARLRAVGVHEEPGAAASAVDPSAGQPRGTGS